MNTSMKIGLVCPYNMLETSGGVGELVINLRNGLAKKGHTVKIITPRPIGYHGEVPENYILLGTSTKFTGVLATSGSVTFHVSQDDVKQVLEQEKFDLINFHEPWSPILARQILQVSEVAHVGTFHANLIDSVAAKTLVNILKSYGRNIGEKMDYITAVSPAPAKVLLDKDPESKYIKNFCYVPNGINVKLYRTRPKSLAAAQPTKMKTIFYIGRLEARKGLKYLLQAYKELSARTSDVQLVLAGTGPDEEKLREYVDQYEIPRVSFLGYIPDEEEIEWLHKSDVFCSPATRGESFGIVLLEAMAAGCPVVAGDNVGYEAVMKETGAISLVNPRDTKDFARKLDIMLHDENVRKLWKTWAKQYVEQYDYVHIVDQYEKVYKDALKFHQKQPVVKKQRFGGLLRQAP